jgi:hypothetical protein
MPYVLERVKTTIFEKIMTIQEEVEQNYKASMWGLRLGILASTILALILAAPIGALAQGAKKLADTFEERYPAEQAPTQPPADRDDAQQNRLSEAQKNRPPQAVQRKKVVKLTAPTRAVSAKRSPSRVVVVPRSFLDAGTEVLPGERKFLDYAFSQTHTAMEVVTNTGGRVGWHNSPLPGPFFPSR